MIQFLLDWPLSPESFLLVEFLINLFSSEKFPDKGYDVVIFIILSVKIVTGEFASIDSCEEQLFDFAKLGYKDLTSTATGKTYAFPNLFVQYLDKNIRESETVSGDTVEDFVNKLSTSANIEASYAGFGGSIKAEFNESSEYSRFDSYTRLQYNATFWRLKIDDSAGNPRDILKDLVRNEIDNIDPNQLYEKYGTHYVNDITVGGRCVTSAVTNKLTCNKKQSFGVYLTAKYEMGAFGASASAAVTKEEEYKKFNETSTFKTKITGGDPSAYGSDSNPKFEAWATTVKDHPMMIDIGSRQGLIPIWKLAETEGRQQQLKNAMDEYFKTHKIDFNVQYGPVFEVRTLGGRVQYNDDGSGADSAFTVFKPDLSDGWFWLGQRGFGPYYPPESDIYPVYAIRPKAWAKGALVPMATYSKIWDDTGSGKSKAYHIFRPVPEQPVDYVALSHFFIVDESDYNLPSAEATKGLMAVHREFIIQGSVGGKMWTDEGTSAAYRGSCWEINTPLDGFYSGFWVGNNDYSPPSNIDAVCLQRSAVELV